MEHYQLEQEIVKLVRQQIGAVAALRNVVIVQRLPKTRSGKMLRKLMRSIVDGENFQIPSTIDDESIVDEIIQDLTKYEIGIYKVNN
jgi:propionyl-CoA synthetase